MGAGGTLFLVLCAVVSLDAEVAGVPLFLITLLAAFFFTDGGFAIVGPYAAEVWPQRPRASGMGSASGFGGVGRIAGPVGLALIAGSSEIVSPKPPSTPSRRPSCSWPPSRRSAGSSTAS
jgi:MFS transporter, putative metabolite:H+ symporter